MEVTGGRLQLKRRQDSSPEESEPDMGLELQHLIHSFVHSFIHSNTFQNQTTELDNRQSIYGSATMKGPVIHFYDFCLYPRGNKEPLTESF